MKSELAVAKDMLKESEAQLAVGGRCGDKEGSGRGLAALRSQVEGVAKAEQERERNVRRMMREMQDMKEELATTRTGRDSFWKTSKYEVDNSGRVY